MNKRKVLNSTGAGIATTSEEAPQAKRSKKTLADIEVENRIKYAIGVVRLQEKLADARQDALISIITKKGAMEGTELDDFNQIAAKYGYLAAMHTGGDDDPDLALWIAQKLTDEAKSFLAKHAQYLRDGLELTTSVADRERYQQMLATEIYTYENACKEEKFRTLSVLQKAA